MRILAKCPNCGSVLESNWKIELQLTVHGYAYIICPNTFCHRFYRLDANGKLEEIENITDEIFIRAVKAENRSQCKR